MSNLASFWMGEELGFLSRLCIASAFDVGHGFTLYSYEPDGIRDVPEGVDLRDAEEIMPRLNFLHYRDSGSPSLGSNFFRYRMLQQGKGPWVDLDMLMLKPIPRDDYVFGSEHQGTVNTAIMQAPADSALVEQLNWLANNLKCPPWYGPKRRLQYWWRRLTSSDFTVANMPWGTTGPQLLTYCVEQQGLNGEVDPPEIWYPIPWREIRLLYGPLERVEAMLSEKTRGIHLYASQLRELAKSDPPAGSFMAREAMRLGVRVDQ